MREMFRHDDYFYRRIFYKRILFSFNQLNMMIFDSVYFRILERYQVYKNKDLIESFSLPVIIGTFAP